MKLHLPLLAVAAYLTIDTLLGASVWRFVTQPLLHQLAVALGGAK